MSKLSFMLIAAIAAATFLTAPAAGQFEGSLLQLLVLTYPTSIVIGALCVAILSFTYKSLAGFPAEAVLKPKR